MKKNRQTTEFSLTEPELVAILRDLLVKQKLIGGEDKVLQVRPVMRSEEIPGADVHDCSYREVFSGLTVVVENK